MQDSTPDHIAGAPSRSLGQGCTIAFLGLVAVQEICGPGFHAPGELAFADYLLLAFFAGAVFWLLAARLVRAVAPGAPG